VGVTVKFSLNEKFLEKCKVSPREFAYSVSIDLRWLRSIQILYWPVDSKYLWVFPGFFPLPTGYACRCAPALRDQLLVRKNSLLSHVFLLPIMLCLVSFWRWVFQVRIVSSGRISNGSTESTIYD